MKFIFQILCFSTAMASESISLPAPKMDGGMPLYEVLKNRSTNRSFDANKDLSREQLSQILWAAAGVNREDAEKSGSKRTAPSAWGNNELSLYVLLKEGTYKYEALGHKLLLISKADNRVFGGKQAFVKDAPLTIILVADLSKITQVPDESSKMVVSQMDAGYVAQNIYLAAASENLVTGSREMIDKVKLSEVLKLSKSERIIIANSVGYLK